MDTITLNEKTPLTKQVPKRVVDVEMFRAGEQTDSDGDRALFTEDDLDQTVSTYDPKVHEAPLIVGHDQDDATPSLGWVRNLWRKGKSLWGKVELTPRAEKLISDGIFKKVSVSFYAPGADANPYPGKLSLRHLALVNIPAVKGLAEFTESVPADTITVDFSEQKSKALFKDILDTTNIMAKPRKKRISNHAEGPMHVTINVGGSGEGGKNPENIALYDDGGNQMSPDGVPTSFMEDDMSMYSSQPEYADEEEEFPDLEGGDDAEAPPTDDSMEDEAPVDPEADAPEGEDEAPEDQLTDDSMEEEAPVDDISDETDDDDEKVNQLAANYSALELAKALMIQKQSSDMMESDNMSDMDTQNFAEAEAGADSEPDSEPDEDKDDSAEYAEDDGADDAEDKTPQMFKKKKKGEAEDDESSEYGCGGEKKYSEDEDDDDEESTESESESESSTLKERVAQLEKELAEQRKMAREKEISDFCEKIYQGGKLTEQIVPKNDLVRFMTTLNGKNSVNFSESGRKSQFDFFSDVLCNLPQLVNFSEVAPEATAPKRKSPQAPANGFAYDNSNLDIHAKALEFSEAKGVDYITALKSVIE